MKAYMIKIGGRWLYSSKSDDRIYVFDVNEFEDATIYDSREDVDDVLEEAKTRSYLNGEIEVLELELLYEKPLSHPRPNFPGVESIIDDCGNVCGYIAKGWGISPQDFLGGIERLGEEERFTLEYVEKAMREECLRCIPVHKSLRPFVSYSYMYYPSKPGRGAFNATTLYVY